MLQFKPITLQDIQEIRPYLDKQSYRTCDFTVGGIYMWIDFFHYEYCIDHGLLFIKGKAEDEPDKASFAVPIGDASVRQGIELLREYCSNRQIPLLLSAVPQEAAEQLAITYSTRSQQLPDWSDYLYLRQDLATLAGRKYQKKRNHVNKFHASYPHTSYRPLNADNLEDVKAFFLRFKAANQKENPYFAFEEAMVDRVLEHFSELNLLGGVLYVEDDIAAFAIGEVVNDTLFVHVEKALTEYNGAYEAINQQFARQATGNPEVIYVNREEDVGDEGIRRAKLSYQPARLLYKFNISIE